MPSTRGFVVCAEHQCCFERQDTVAHPKLLRLQCPHGRHDSLAHAKANAEQRAKLGSATVLTPVRRSTRKSAAAASPALSRQLEASHWAYSPNVAGFGVERDNVATGGDDAGEGDVRALLRGMHALRLGAHSEGGVQAQAISTLRGSSGSDSSYQGDHVEGAAGSRQGVSELATKASSQDEGAAGDFRARAAAQEGGIASQRTPGRLTSAALGDL